MGRHRITLGNSVPPHPHYRVYSGAYLSPFWFVLYTAIIRWPSRPIPARHITRSVVRSDELLNSTYGRSAIGVERSILDPSIFYRKRVRAQVGGKR